MFQKKKSLAFCAAVVAAGAFSLSSGFVSAQTTVLNTGTATSTITGTINISGLDKQKMLNQIQAAISNIQQTLTYNTHQLRRRAATAESKCGKFGPRPCSANERRAMRRAAPQLPILREACFPAGTVRVSAVLSPVAATQQRMLPETPIPTLTEH